MAPRRRTPNQHLLPASSSEEETTGEEEQESSSGEEDEQQQTQAPKPLTEKPDLAAKLPDSESETESDPDSDDEQPDNIPPAPVKPIVSKPMEEIPPKKAISKPSAAASKSTPAKRAGETDTGSKGAKRAKSEVDGVVDKSEETKKPTLFQRRFSEDDEIAVLKGIIDFKGREGIDPSKDMNGFHEFVKKSLNCDVSVEQLKDKVRRLRRKFGRIVKRSKAGENRTFSKAHEQKGFDLSKEIWGSEATAGGVESSGKPNGAIEGREGGKKRGEAGAKGEDGVMGECLSELLGMEGLEERTRRFLINNVGLVEKVKLRELEAEWERLKKGEVELFLKRLDLVKKTVKVVMEAVSS